LAGWLTRFVGPKDKRFNAVTWLPIGNSLLPQNQAGALLSYASELKEGDPLREACIAVYQQMEPDFTAIGYDIPLLCVATADVNRKRNVPALDSEHMDELGVAMRHDHPSEKQSCLFQKIGFWKDHYENDETSLNWYAKSTPLLMDYGTYTARASTAAAHNLVEIPDMDSLQRGYLAQSMFSSAVDYTRCEVPITQKLLHGRLRTFEEVDATTSEKPMYFYIGDENPIGPKAWKRRLLLYVKPDYLVIYDRVFGAAAHRYNLHVTANSIEREGAYITAAGRFDLDLLCFVQHPTSFVYSNGEFYPAEPTDKGRRASAEAQRQCFFRLINKTDGVYRTVLFAREKQRKVDIAAIGTCGVRITTAEYADYVFLSDDWLSVAQPDVRFEGHAGWIRKHADGVCAVMPDGDSIAAHGKTIAGRGPWTYNLGGKGELEVRGVPRIIRMS
jgi:hypothetical protein